MRKPRRGWQAKIKTVAEEWEAFLAAVFPEGGAPEDQVREMRRAFYAGGWALL